VNTSDPHPFESVITALEGQGKRIKRLNPREAMVQCPAHEDRNPSLHVTDGGDKVLLYCHAGCPTKSILDAIGLDDDDLFAEKGKTREETDHYDYLDAEGKLRLQVVRFYPKDFRQRRPMPGGQWAWNLHGVTPILYRLPEVLAAPDIVYLTEGEKDADRLASEGVVATTAPMGAGKWRDEYAQSLVGKRVIIIADRDEQGYAHAERVAESLRAAGVVHKIVQAKEGKDVSDHLDRGHSLEELEPATGTAPVTSTRRLPGRNENEAEIVVGPLHVRATKPYRTGRGYASQVFPTVTVMGKAHRVHWGVEVALVSASGRGGLITALNRIDGIDKAEVATWVETLFIELIAWSEVRPEVIRTSEYQPPPSDSPALLLSPWWAASGATVIAGAPGSYKSYLALAFALSVHHGELLIYAADPIQARIQRQARTLVLDWEASIDRVYPRVQALRPGADLHYLELHQPLASAGPWLTEYVRDNGYEAVVIDSLSASIGGSLIDEEIANRYWDAVSALGVPALVVAHKSADSIRNRRARLFGSIMHEARPRLIHNVETQASYIVVDCFKDSDYGLRGIKTAWDVEFETPGEFQPAHRVRFNPIPANSVVFEDDEEQPQRRGQPQLTEAQVRRVLLRDTLMDGASLSPTRAQELLAEAGIEVDVRRVRDDLAHLAADYSEIEAREMPSAGGRPTLEYRWTATL
jgi:5S rRNA maturation endonuclease (ribonuclease M5)